ncbi:FAD-dependent oxidoreductase [Sphingomonas sp. FW199]|uniref:FAD-dependent oxidoreductase n=1 Tax=Sphingomonas sp. FW199 TaxID=3400217 RepID=UPI003CFAB238
MSQPDADVIVVGSGAGGLSAAVTAARLGLTVLVLEKSDLVGGTTARSGGVLWLPGNPVAARAGVTDDVAAARTYMQAMAGNCFDAERVDAFLAIGPEMVEFFERETCVAFVAQPGFPDYNADRPGASAGGRSIVAAPMDGRELGPDIRRLRPPLREITFVGMMFNASQEVQHFFRATRSLTSAIYVARRLAVHGWEMLRHGRAMRLTNGNALAARLFASAIDNGVEIRTRTGLAELIEQDGRAAGVVTDGGERLFARHAVILAAGGFPRGTARQNRLFPHVATGGQHLSPAPESNQGDTLAAGESLGARVREDLPNAAAWIPVSAVPRRKGPPGVFPHLIDRYKPGIIAVDPWGRRFVNEANSYHDFGQAMLERCRRDGQVYAWLIADHRALRRYGLGIVKPFPVPYGRWIRSGYLRRGRSVVELATAIGCHSELLSATLNRFNLDALQGRDSQYGKGSTPYNRYLGDPRHLPNACIAPLDQAPFYAVKLEMGDLGTFAGLSTDAKARVLDVAGQPIRGLFAAGNDAASVMGGAYPGGGITLGPAMTFGYIAARAIARDAGLEN